MKIPKKLRSEYGDVLNVSVIIRGYSHRILFRYEQVELIIKLTYEQLLERRTIPFYYHIPKEKTMEKIMLSEIRDMANKMGFENVEFIYDEK